MDLLENTGHPGISRARVVFGLMVILIGGVLLLDRLDWAGFHLNVPLWPCVLMLLGLARIGERRASGRTGINRSGAWLIFLASWGFINEYRLWGFTYGTSWPLLIVGAGAIMVWRAVAPMDDTQCSKS
jgi:LiaF transmembrane domain